MTDADNVPSPTTRIKPPFTLETACAKVKAAENVWNSRDPEIVGRAIWSIPSGRNWTEFLQGRQAIKAFLKRRWEKELDHRLMKKLWCFTGNRISARIECEWHE